VTSSLAAFEIAIMVKSDVLRKSPWWKIVYTKNLQLVKASWCQRTRWHRVWRISLWFAGETYSYSASLAA